jgi:serine/threonine-protein kinase
VVALVFAVAFAPSANGQSAGNDKVAAESLFEEGRALVQAGKYAEACPKFASSQRLDPSPATLLNLASCREKLGQSATAWATYKEAASAANAAGRSDYVATAQRHAEALSPKLARLTIVVPQPVEGLQVNRDGMQIDRAEWGGSIPIDSGMHIVAARAPGYRDWSSSIEVEHDGAQVSVTVPSLEVLPPEAKSVLPPAAAAPSGTQDAAPVALPRDDSISPGRGQRIAGLIVGASGVVGLGVGAGLALVANGKYHDSLSNCTASNPDLCNATGVAQRSDARTAGDAASVAVSVGAAALVGGAVIWLTAPSASGPGTAGGLRAGIAATLGGAVVRGVW